MSASTAVATRLSLDELDRLCSILSAELRLTLVPGEEWAWHRPARKLMYPRQRLMKMRPAEATGYLWRTVQHAISSHSQLDAYDVAVDTVLECERQTGERAMHPKWVMGLMFAAERERVEALARRNARNLGNSFLPPRGMGYRVDQANIDRCIIGASSSTSTQYWQRVAVALGALAAGSFEKDELPGDMPWSNSIVERICALPTALTYDELLEGVEALVPDLVKAQLERLAQDPSDEGNRLQQAGGRGAADSTASGGGSRGDGSSPASADHTHESQVSRSANPVEDESAEEAARPKASNDRAEDNDDHETDSRFIPAEDLEQLAEEVNAAGDERVAIDYFEDDAQAKPDDAEHAQPAGGWGNSGYRVFSKTAGPAWNAVSRTNAHVITPIRRTLLQYLAENEVGELEHGTRSGRLDYRYATKPAHLLTQPPFCRRTQTDERSYAIGLIVDRSGSMSDHCDGLAFPEAFGDGPLLRWHLAARLTVALAEALARVPGTQTAIVAYDGVVDLIKRVGESLSPAVRQRVMNAMVARGNNDDAGALNAMARELRAASAQCKLIFHLTDGQFCSGAGDVKHMVHELQRAGIGLVVLTLGIKPEFAYKFVPVSMADEITDATVAKVLARHVGRMLDPRRRDNRVVVALATA